MPPPPSTAAGPADLAERTKRPRSPMQSGGGNGGQPTDGGHGVPNGVPISMPNGAHHGAPNGVHPNGVLSGAQGGAPNGFGGVPTGIPNADGANREYPTAYPNAYPSVNAPNGVPNGFVPNGVNVPPPTPTPDWRASLSGLERVQICQHTLGVLWRKSPPLVPFLPFLSSRHISNMSMMQLQNSTRALKRKASAAQRPTSNTVRTEKQTIATSTSASSRALSRTSAGRRPRTIGRLRRGDSTGARHRRQVYCRRRCRLLSPRCSQRLACLLCGRLCRCLHICLCPCLCPCRRLSLHRCLHRCQHRCLYICLARARSHSGGRHRRRSPARQTRRARQLSTTTGRGCSDSFPTTLSTRRSPEAFLADRAVAGIGLSIASMACLFVHGASTPPASRSDLPAYCESYRLRNPVKNLQNLQFRATW